jgi:hypothetical protein
MYEALEASVLLNYARQRWQERKDSNVDALVDLKPDEPAKQQNPSRIATPQGIMR